MLHPLEYQTTLASGRVVSLTALHVERTYAGLMEGSPDANYNDRLIEQERRRMTPIWGERPTEPLRVPRSGSEPFYGVCSGPVNSCGYLV